MSFPPENKYLGIPFYYREEFTTDTTGTYRTLYFKPNVEPESGKWQPRSPLVSGFVSWLPPLEVICVYCFIVALVLSLIIVIVQIAAPDASKVVHSLLTLQFFVICVQNYCIAKKLLALRRESRKQKGRGYDLFVGPAYTSTLALPPAETGLDVPPLSKDSDNAHISRQAEKVSLGE
ncbi:hypothetical protein N7471_006624 [Penicillium samsonianum]|uniref:uncharacterized protein n=1 Tax=Penicillium samsonianum TaxID=1882272 RepID=UPI0025468E02|nr:uncharacterized protein N7471_006624 [Penicillium samsonianum]KAJ6140138.1 hypothetical protein N7471_006624 [Penicillium samsonianum]